MKLLINYKEEIIRNPYTKVFEQVFVYGKDFDKRFCSRLNTISLITWQILPSPCFVTVLTLGISKLTARSAFSTIEVYFSVGI